MDLRFLEFRMNEKIKNKDSVEMPMNRGSLPNNENWITTF